MKKQIASIALLGCLSTQAFALIPNKVECVINEDVNHSSIQSVILERTSDKFDMIVNAKLLDDRGRLVHEYKSARAHSGGGAQGWLEHPLVPGDKIVADYYGRDYCIDSEPVTERSGGLFGFGGTETIVDYKCLYQGGDITVMEIRPVPAREDDSRDFEIDDYIEKVTIKDTALAQEVGTLAYVEFNNCEAIE